MRATAGTMSMMGWVRLLPGAVTAASLFFAASEAAAERIVFLNLGATTLNADNGQDPTLDSFTSTGFTAGPISGLTLDEAQRAQLMFFFKEAGTPFDLTFTFDRPASGTYDMVVFGTQADANALFPDNACSAAIGLADCGDGSAENISFMFYGCLPASQQDDMRRIAFNALVGLGFGWGLENEVSTGQVMGSYSVFGLKFGDTCIDINGATCPEHPGCSAGQQNATTDLTAIIGARVDDGPPTLAITEPADGSTVPASFTLSADVDDKFGGLTVEMEIVEESFVDQLEEPPYSWDLSGVAAGDYTLRVHATDADGNLVTEQVSVTVDGEEPPPETTGDDGSGGNSESDTETDPSGDPSAGNSNSGSDTTSGDDDDDAEDTEESAGSGGSDAPIDPTAPVDPAAFGGGGTGCQCTSTPRPTDGWMAWLLVFSAMGWRRRGRTSTRPSPTSTSPDRTSR